MLTVNNISKRYRKTRKRFFNQYTYALHPTSFHLLQGKALGVVGESGSGKSTLAHLILGLEKPDTGCVIFHSEKDQDKSVQHRSKISIVFQDYLSSVNPYMQANEIILEPIQIHKHAFTDLNKINKSQFVYNLLDKVGLARSVFFKYPQELSGGQLQRLCIARSLSVYPKCIIFDEPTSSLDMINQLKVLDLLNALKKEFELTYLFISHDIQAVSYVCDDLLFLHKGSITEQIETKNLRHVKTDYAKYLLSSAN